MPDILHADQRHNVRRYGMYPRTEAIIAALVVFCAVLVTSYFIYVRALDAQKGEIREGLQRTVVVAAQLIDGDLHPSFTNREQENSEAYKKAVAPLGAILAANSQFAYVYTAILKDDGKVYFVLDSTPKDAADAVHLMDEYDNANPDIIRALKEETMVVSKEPYTDEWGSFISGYVPLYDSKHKFVGVLGMDIRVEQYFERLKPTKRATVRAMVTGGFLAFSIGIFTWFVRRFSAELNRSRIAIMEDLREALKRMRG